LFYTLEYFFLHPTQRQQRGVSNDFDDPPLFRKRLQENMFCKEDVLSFVVDYDTPAEHFQGRLKVATPNLG